MRSSATNFDKLLFMKKANPLSTRALLKIKLINHITKNGALCIKYNDWKCASFIMHIAIFVLSINPISGHSNRTSRSSNVSVTF